LDPRISAVDLPAARETSYDVLSQNDETVQNMQPVGRMNVQMFYLQHLYNPDSELFAHLESVYHEEEENIQDESARSE